MRTRTSEELSLLLQARHEAEPLVPMRPVSPITRFLEEDAAYRGEARIAAGARMAERAVEEIAALDERITERTKGNPRLELLLRSYIEETLGFCSGELIAPHHGAPVMWGLVLAAGAICAVTIFCLWNDYVAERQKVTELEGRLAYVQRQLNQLKTKDDRIIGELMRRGEERLQQLERDYYQRRDDR